MYARDIVTSDAPKAKNRGHERRATEAGWRRAIGQLWVGGDVTLGLQPTELSGVDRSQCPVALVELLEVQRATKLRPPNDGTLRDDHREIQTRFGYDELFPRPFHPSIPSRNGVARTRLRLILTLGSPTTNT